MEKSFKKELLTLYESMLRAQLNVIKQLRRDAGIDEDKREQKGMSQMDMVYDILSEHSRPLHVDVIIKKLTNKFHTHLDKESVVSALAKRVKRQDRFIKTAPNTFTLIDQDV